MQQHRLQVVVPEVYGDTPMWASASLSPGSVAPLPTIGDPVWISFERGDVEEPVWALEPGTPEGAGATGRYIGKYRAVVVDDQDPMDRRRLEVTVPEVDPSPAWAESPLDAGGDPPAVGSEVWIEYENGDPQYPRWVGLV